MGLNDWPIKFRLGEICILDKYGVPTSIEIEGVCIRKSSDCEVIYDVRETEGTRIGYMASQNQISKKPKQLKSQ